MIAEITISRTINLSFEDGDVPCQDPEDEFERLHTLLQKKLKRSGDVRMRVIQEKIIRITRGGKEIHNAE